ncbi:MAG: hypothetical protein M1834_009515 [Cirrosporium novae-zelandiae]|nr:MAG: hypothetical protein M1834_009515 [Cirrosporium novae-zelandiae]
MASATGVPGQVPGMNVNGNGLSRREADEEEEAREQEQDQEQEPLLGRPGDASQKVGKGVQFNLFIGTAVLAQAGVWIVSVLLSFRFLLFAIVWAAVFNANWIYMLQHPLGNSLGLALLTQATLILQPTHTGKQKFWGAIIHGVLHTLGLASFLWAFAIIEINKGPMSNDHHWKSTHAYLGFLTYNLLFIQFVVGVAQFWIPMFSKEQMWMKKIWKWHRVSGYILLVLVLVTVCAATKTDYNKGVLQIQLWAAIVCSVLILAGTLPRIKKQKMPGPGRWW